MDRIKLYAFADEAAPDMDGQIAAMLRNNLNGLEIRGVDGVNIAKISLEKAAEVRRKMDDNGLAVWSVGSPIGKIQITDDFAPHAENFRHTLELAKILGAGNIRLFSFYIPKGEDADSYKNQVLDRLGELLEIAHGSGVTLCHENEKGIYGDTALRCLNLYRNLPELKGIFDPANFVQCNEDTLQAWELLAPYIRYLHIKDAKKAGWVVPPGLGDGNVAEVVSRYLAAGGSVFTLEPHLAIFEGFSHLEKSDMQDVPPEFAFSDSNVAFDTACCAFRALL